MTLSAASLVPGVTYYWKVSAEDGLGGVSFGSGSDRAPWTFTVENPPPPPAPVAPSAPTGGGAGK